MTIFRLIPPKWAKLLKPKEGQFTDDQIKKYNAAGYNIYYFPNYPREFTPGTNVQAVDVDCFKFVFVDYDTKSNTYASKDAFIEAILSSHIAPNLIVDSGNGVHVYWRVDSLDAKSYLRFQRRLVRLFKTDEATCMLNQLMRYPGTINTKVKGDFKPCEILHEDRGFCYTAEDFDKLLPNITKSDEEYCEAHYNKAYGLTEAIDISESLPPRFGMLLNSNPEAKELFAGETDDRSKADYRLGHIMFANGFTKEEALSVLVNSVKAMDRAPVHRKSYAINIVDKIWTYELEENKDELDLSNCVSDILKRPNEVLEGTRITCYKYIDNTISGFRLGQVMGLVAGSGVGKTATALNLFLGFVESNPDLEHFFCTLEEPENDIARRWKVMCGDNDRLHSKVHIISNYDNKGKFRDLSLEEIQDYIIKFKETTSKKVGCVVIDHIGILCNNNKLGQDEGVKQIAKGMKTFAEETDTFLIMQSQTSREKAGIGDLELNKDAAFGTSVFENFCDYLVTLWQPLKRVYSTGAPTIMAYKFCKIRHKKQGHDVILEDVPYALFFSPETQLLRELTEDEETSFKYYLAQATNKRKADRKTELVQYTSIKWSDKPSDTKISSNR